MRKFAVVVGLALIAYAASTIYAAGVSFDGTNELINGRHDTQTIVVPIAIFVVGGMLLAAGVGGRHGGDR